MNENTIFKEYCEKIKINKKRPTLLLLQMPQIDIEVLNIEIAKVKGYYNFPPTGLQYLYEAIKHRNIKVEILDLNFEILKSFLTDEEFVLSNWIDILDKTLKRIKPDIIGVSCLFDFSIKYFIEVLEYIKLNHNAIVLTGGVIATFEWKNILDKELANFVISGEAEEKINYLLDHITTENYNSSPTKNIYFNTNKKINETHSLDVITNFDTDLISSYKLFDIKEYSQYGSLNPFSRTTDGVYNYAVIQRSRGCRASCTFCSVEKIMGKGVRVRSINNIIKEITYLKNEENITHFEWLDDDLLFEKNDFKELLREIIRNELNITWSANNGLIASAVDKEMLELISKSGCIGFKVGVETGNQEMLKKVKKPASLNSFLTLSKNLDAFPNIFVGGNIIIGLPQETFSMLMDTFYFSIKMNYDWAVFTTCQAIRGASAFSEMGEYFEHQMKTKGGDAHNFIPSRSNKNGHIITDKSIKKGLSIFLIDKDEIASSEQIKEIWFTFNLIVNFIFNKNLYKGMNQNKFISWVETARKAYPYNPYMLLFLAVAYKINDNTNLSQERYKLAISKIEDDKYWKDRMNEFSIMHLITNFNNADIFDLLETLRTDIKNKLKKMNIIIMRD